MLKRFINRLIRDKSGSSLLEVLISIVILAMVVVPLGSSFVMAVRLNTQSRELMQQQLAVSNAVEVLMARGIDKALVDSDGTYKADPSEAVFQDVSIQVDVPEGEGKEDHSACYPVTLTYSTGSKPYSLSTTVRWVPTPAADPTEGSEDP